MSNKKAKEDNFNLSEAEGWEHKSPLEVAEETVNKNFPGLWEQIDAGLSCWAELLIKDITLPQTLFFVSVPSSDKTTTIKIMKSLEESFYVDDFSPAGFVSHMTNVKKKDLPELDLLPKIKDKLFLVPELATIWNAPKEKLVNNVGLMTRVLDGDGLTRHTGARGTRGYDEPIMFVWLGATTPIPKRVWWLLGKLGSRLYFYGMNSGMDAKQILERIRGPKAYYKKVRECREAVAKLMVYLRNQYPCKVEWKKNLDDKGLMEKIVTLAVFLSKLRGHIEISYTEDGSPELNPPLIERPDRCATVLYNLARGHALVHGREQINKEDLEHLKVIAYSSAPYDRVKAVEVLLKGGGTLDLETFARELRCTKKPASRIAYVLQSLGLVRVNKDEEGAKKMGGRPTLLIHLLEEYRALTPLVLVNKPSEGVYLRKPTLCVPKKNSNTVTPKSIEEIFDEELH